ncbi:MAG: hypothetical protein J2P15_17380 [Micromonosporaceae bacterium]|nr:hypothetical protein [Micromonosporaceae bacterium]
MWIKAGALGLVVLGLLAVTGIFPGGSTRATVDHCYLRHHDWEPTETRCTGDWTLLGHTFTGRVHGVEVGTDWQVIPPGPGADGWYEVTVPESARDRAALTVPGAALVVAWLVWTGRVLLALALVGLLILLARRALTRRRTRTATWPD